MKNNTYVYDSGTNQYLEVTSLEFAVGHDSLEGTHKFFPGNNSNIFRINGRVFNITVDHLLAHGEERILFIGEKEDNVPQLIATGIMQKVSDVLSEMES